MSATEYVESKFDGFINDLFDLLAQPSISATSEGISECIDLVEQLCRDYGFDTVEIIETPGQPSVIAHAYVGGDPDNEAPTILIYGHYDVQPVTPQEWTTPPFRPTIREGPDGDERIYARGAGDNKGQWFAHLCAVHALRETDGLPTNVTLLLEGEEESGSPNLEHIVRERNDELTADLTYVADGPIDPSGRPHILMGARGMCYVEVNARGANRDLHSGNYGGPIPNPAWELVRIFDSMKDEDGRITIEGFYDDIRPIKELDRDTLDAIPFDSDAVRKELRVDDFATGAGENYLEKLLYFPTLNIAGFTSGYGGEGMKTIIPSKAQAKLDMRLVADQDPNDVFEKFKNHVESHASKTVDLSVEKLGTMRPQRTPLDHPIREPILAAVATGWSTDPILKPTLGGSLPTAVFADQLDIPCVTVPYANSDENNHSPDENLSLACFRNGILTTTELLRRLAESETV
jgi:acetylornithine deacetylase/succinyl-diaminopimelate desuccinylase-like protein